MFAKFGYIPLLLTLLVLLEGEGVIDVHNTLGVVYYMGPSLCSMGLLVVEGGVAFCRRVLGKACICHVVVEEASTSPCSKDHRDLCRGPCMGAQVLGAFHGIYNRYRSHNTFSSLQSR